MKVFPSPRATPSETYDDGAAAEVVSGAGGLRQQGGAEVDAVTQRGARVQAQAESMLLQVPNHIEAAAAATAAAAAAQKHQTSSIL